MPRVITRLNGLTVPATEFVIEQKPDGTCDVHRNRRAFAYDCDDIDEALMRIRRKLTTEKKPSRGVEVTHIEPDGYPRRIRT